MIKELTRIFILSFLLINNAFAQKINVINLTDTIRTDSSLKKGVLKNGFTYYLKKDDKSTDNISISFVVKAGEEQEDEDQIELAHLLEHVALRSTRNFPNVKTYLETYNLVWGKDFNGHTNPNSTSYKIDIPSGNNQLLTSCLLLVKDWVDGGVDLGLDKINAEKGPVLQERARNGGPSQSAMFGYLPNVAGLPDDHRMMAKIENNIRDFKPESLHRFYKDWYTPDNVALIINGNININKLENQIIDLYSNIKGKGKKHLNEPSNESSLNRANQYVGLSIDNYDRTECKIYFKLPYQPIHTYVDESKDWERQLIASMINFRLKNSENSQHVNSAINFRYEKMITVYKPWTSSFLIDIDNVQDSIQTIIQTAMYEVYRVKNYGFYQWELDSAKRQMLSWIDEEAMKPLESQHYESNFINHTPIADPPHKATYSRQLVNGISLEEINEFLLTWSIDKNRDFVIITSDEKKHLLPNELLLNEWVMQAFNDKMSPFKIMKPTAEKLEYFPPLMSDEQLAKLESVQPIGLQQSDIRSINATKISLPNGMTVVLKPSTDKNENAYVDIINSSNVYSKHRKDSLMVKFASDIVTQSGVGLFNAKNWKRYKEQKGIGFSSKMTSDYALFSFQSPQENLESLLQTIHLLFVVPKIDSAFLTEWKATKLAEVNKITNEAKVNTRRSDNFLNIFPTTTSMLSGLEDMNENDALKMHKELFSCDSRPTIIFTGNFDINAVNSLIVKYLYTVSPAKKMGNQESVTIAKPIYRPLTIETSEAESQTSFVTMHIPALGQNRSYNSLLAELISNEFRKLSMERLRSKEGISYAPSSFVTNNDKYSNVNCFVSVFFDCTQERVNDAVKYLQEEFIKLRLDSVQSRMLEEAKVKVLKNYNKVENSAKFWQNYLIDNIGKKGDVDKIDNYERIIRDITPQEMSKFASSFDTDNYSLFVSHPKSLFDKTSSAHHPLVNIDSAKLLSEINNYMKLKNYEAMISSYCEFYDRFGLKESSSDLNMAAWTIFSYSMDTEELNKAISWVRLAIKKATTVDRPKYVDTYAQLLYKTGNKDEALKEQKKAIETVVLRRLGEFCVTYYKMLNNQPTWKIPTVKAAPNVHKIYWNHLKPVLKKFSTFQQDSIIAYAKTQYAKDFYRSKYPNFLITYFGKYITRKGTSDLNNNAWEIFIHSKNKKELAKALSWSEESLKEQFITQYLDTYANLLYKMGKKEEAIAAIQKAIEISPEDQKKTYQKTFEKMKSGKPTWED